MGVAGRAVLRVLQGDDPAIAAEPADLHHLAIRGGEHRGATGRREVDALVLPGIAEHRMRPHAEAGGDPRAVERGAEEGAAQAAALVVEPVRAGLGLVPPEREAAAG